MIHASHSLYDVKWVPYCLRQKNKTEKNIIHAVISAKKHVFLFSRNSFLILIYNKILINVTKRIIEHQDTYKIQSHTKKMRCQFEEREEIWLSDAIEIVQGDGERECVREKMSEWYLIVFVCWRFIFGYIFDFAILLNGL